MFPFTVQLVICYLFTDYILGVCEENPIIPFFHKNRYFSHSNCFNSTFIENVQALVIRFCFELLKALDWRENLLSRMKTVF